jgi:uncharacterized protein YceK
VRKTISMLLLMTATAVVSGCSTVSLPESAKLAQAGQEASNDLATYYRSTGAAVPLVLEMEVIRSALGTGISPPSQQFIEDIERIKLSMGHRTQVAKRLEKLYSALYELSATDYPGQVEKSITGLSAEIAGFADAIGQPNPIKGTIADLAPGVFGFIAKEAQKKRVRKANLILQGQLEGLSTLLIADNDAISAIREEMAAQGEKTSLAVWQTGTVSARKLLARYVTSDGLELVSEETDFTAKNPRISLAVEKIIKFRLKEVRAAEARRYDAFEDVVSELSAGHTEIARGAPLNLDGLLQLVSELNELLAPAVEG